MKRKNEGGHRGGRGGRGGHRGGGRGGRHFDNNNDTDASKKMRFDANDEDNDGSYTRPVLLRLDEEKVGITEYLGDKSHSFHGVMKQRYSDFIVSEVDKSGNVAKLTELFVRDELKPDKPQEATPEAGLTQIEAMYDAKTAQKIKDFLDNEANYTEQQRRKLERYQAEWQQYQQQQQQRQDESVPQQGEANAESKPVVAGGEEEQDIPDFIVLESDSDKERRGKFHQIVKQCFPSIISDTAVGEGGERCMRLRYKPNNLTKQLQGAIRRNQKYMNKQDGQQPEGEDNDDTTTATNNNEAQRGGRDALRYDSRRRPEWPKTRPPYLKFILYKENKDTTNAINLLAKTLGVTHKAFAIAGTKDKRGITTQWVTANRVTAEKMLTFNAIKGKYEQIRVGNFEYVPDQLRLGDLAGNRFTIVLRNLQGEDDHVNESVASARDNGFINYFGMQRFGNAPISTHEVGIQVLKQDWKQACTLILTAREKLAKPELKQALEYWRNNEIDKAVEVLPRHYVSERPILVAYKQNPGNHRIAFHALPRNLRLIYVHSYQSYVWNTMVSERLRRYGPKPVVGDLVYVDKNAVDDDDFADEDGGTAAEEDLPEASSSSSYIGQHATIKNAAVKTLQEQDLANYTIFDVLMPIPGFVVQFPTHELGKQAYLDFMARDGITLESFEFCKAQYFLYGGYRKIITKPKDVEWSILRYDDFTTPLALTDRDRLEGKKTEVESKPDGQKKALVISFTLPSSTYATMFMREVMKTSSALDWAEVNETKETEQTKEQHMEAVEHQQ